MKTALWSCCYCGGRPDRLHRIPLHLLLSYGYAPVPKLLEESDPFVRVCTPCAIKRGLVCPIHSTPLEQEPWSEHWHCQICFAEFQKAALSRAREIFAGKRQQLIEREGLAGLLFATQRSWLNLHSLRFDLVQTAVIEASSGVADSIELVTGFRSEMRTLLKDLV